jgi:DNA polymerase-3 subunit alpha/error-prone DNA polymerase
VRDPFVPLHLKSTGSLGCGTATVAEIVDRASRDGLRALAITDVESLHLQVELHHRARALGIRPITGVELRSGHGPRALGSRKGRLVLLARDRDGYESLCRIVSLRRTARPPFDDDPLRCLDAEPTGLFFLSDDPRVVEALSREGVARDDVFFLLVRPGGDEPPAGVRAVADCDVSMLEPADRDLHRLLAAIRARERFLEDDAGGDEEARSLPSPADACARFADVPDALSAAEEIADACTLDLRERRPQLEGRQDAERLERKVRALFGAGRGEGRFAAAVYARRLEDELALLSRHDLASYLLVVAEIVERAKVLGIATAARGSASGSLVAHVLGIGGVDPVAEGLVFERFVHPSRRDLPDIDLDVASDRRDELVDWVVCRFGRDRVARVSAHVTFGRRAAFRAGLAALGAAPSEIERVVERIPREELDPREPIPPSGHLVRPSIARRLALVERLVGRMRHVAVHAGGIVIADPRVDRHVPLERTSSGAVVTQLDAHALEEIGIAKIDLLGNRALAAIQEARRRIPSGEPAVDGDAETVAALRAGRTVGCFQIETPLLRSTLRRFNVRGIADLAAALAIVRPGPAAGESRSRFLRRSNGEEAPTPPHPRLARALERTFGTMLYEEDVIAAIAAVSGRTLAEADALRAAIVRAGDDPAGTAALERGFIEDAARNGVEPEGALRVWRAIARFAAYAFNKAHASSYARIAWETAWLRTHHPAAFACGVLSHYGGAYPLRTVAADLARDGVRIEAPDVGRSGAATGLEGGAVRLGLSTIQGLRGRTRARIVEGRPFADLTDLLERVRPSPRELEALVLCGACDELLPLSPAVYPFGHEDVLARLRRGEADGALPDRELPRGTGPGAGLHARLARIANEIRFLSVHPSGHPISVLREEASRAGCIPASELSDHAGRNVRIAALVAASRRLSASDGRPMQFASVEDETGLVEAAIFPDVYASLGDPVRAPGPFLVSGRAGASLEEIDLEVSEIVPFHLRARPYA